MADNKYRVRIGLKGKVMGTVPFKSTLAFNLPESLRDAMMSIKPFIDGLKAESSTWMLSGRGFCEVVPKESA